MINNHHSKSELTDLNLRIEMLEKEIHRLHQVELKSHNLLVALNAMRVGIWEWDIASGKTFFNERWAEIIGYKLKELEPTNIETWVRFVHPDDYVLANQKLAAYLSGESDSYNIDFRMRHKDGYWVWVQDIGQITQWDQNQKPIRMYGTHTDITYRYQLEENKIRARYHDLIENAPFPIVIARVSDQTLRYGNKRAMEQFGFTSNEGVGLSTLDFYVNPIDRDEFMGKLMKQGYVYDFEIELYDYHKQRYWALMSASFTNYEEEPSIIVTINNINERKKTEFQLIKEREIYELLTTSMADIIWVYNVDQNKVVYMSPTIEKTIGYSNEEAMKLTLYEFMTDESRTLFLEEVRKNVEIFKKDSTQSQPFILEVQHVTKERKALWFELSSKIRRTTEGEIELIHSSRNIEERYQAKQRIEYINLHDPLTGLLNKTSFRLLELDEPFSRQSQPFSLIYVDVDNFGIVNDTVGHRDGDQIIYGIAHKIDQYIKGKGTVYHYDGDEFVILIENNEFKQVENIAKELIRSVATQIRVQEREYILTCSIGVALSQDGESLTKVFKNAGTALFVAKRIRNTIRFYNEDMEQTHAREVILEKDLSLAIERNQFELYFQPIYDVRKGVINHAEALLRWNHPDFGVVSPVEFIPVAERTKIIIPLTDWVFKNVCIALKSWEKQGINDLIVSMNVSLTALVNRSENLYNFIRFTLLEYKVNPSHIKLEVTESSLLQDSVEIIRIFNLLKELGVKLELDDFGTGYSSFGYLKSLPLDIVKIDRSLINDIETDPKEKMILESMITILHGLNLEVVIEGVETLEQFNKIVPLRPDYIQGYLFNKPIKENDFLRYYEASKDARNLPVAYRIKSYPEFVLHWREEWNSGIDIIDDEHRDLMKTAAYIEQNRLKPMDESQLNNAYFEALIESIQQHFIDEEAIISDKGYPFASQHRDEHLKLINQAHKLRDLHLSDSSQTDGFINFLVRELILDHIINEDAAFFPFLRNAHYTQTHFPSVEAIMEEIDTNDASHYHRLLKENVILQNLLSDISHLFVRVELDDFDQKVDEALKRCARQVNADRAYVFTYDWDKMTCKNTHEWCQEGIVPQILELESTPVEYMTDWVNTHKQGKAMNIYDVKSLPEDSTLRQALELQDIWSILTVPMMNGTECFGFIGFDSVLKHHMYTDFERSILQEVSNVILVAMKRRIAEIQINTEKDLFETTIASLDEGLIIINKDKEISFMNPVAMTMLATSLEECTGHNIDEIFMPVNLLTTEKVEIKYDQLQQDGQSFEFKPNTGLISIEGDKAYISGRVTPIKSNSRNFEGFLIHIRDVTIEYEYEGQIDAFLNINLDMLCVADLNGYFRRVNQRFSDVLGYEINELNGKRFLDLVHPEDVQDTIDVMANLPDIKIIHGFANRYLHKDGSYRFIEWSSQIGYGKLLYASARDVTGRKMIEAQKEYNSYHDGMTDLYNRRYLEEVFKNIEIDRRIHPISILMCDLDDLKTINDTFGHESGDQSIIEVAKNIKAHCRPDDIIGRWGGDEFIVLLPKTSHEDALKIAQRISETKLTIQDGKHPVVASIGVATKENENVRFPDVLRLADQNMYIDKNKKKNHKS